MTLHVCDGGTECSIYGALLDLRRSIEEVPLANPGSITPRYFEMSGATPGDHIKHASKKIF